MHFPLSPLLTSAHRALVQKDEGYDLLAPETQDPDADPLDPSDPTAAAAAAGQINGINGNGNGDHDAQDDANGAATGGGGGAGAAATIVGERQPNKVRVTTPYLTKYERARILGTRALQIRCVFAFCVASLFVFCVRSQSQSQSRLTIIAFTPPTLSPSPSLPRPSP